MCDGAQVHLSRLTYQPSDTAWPLVDIQDLSFGSASITAILGPNGAGKTLLAKLLQGIKTPTTGTIQIAGFTHHAEALQSIGTVPQKPVLLRRSVAANMDFSLKLRGVIDRNQKRATLLNAVNLSDHARKPARLLSGGEQQRLALARALALDPKILILDEATANLDPHSTLQIEKQVKYFADNGIKMIMITHDIHQAKRLADEVILMNKGKIIEHARADAFFNAPKSDMTRAFLSGDILI